MKIKQEKYKWHMLLTRIYSYIMAQLEANLYYTINCWSQIRCNSQLLCLDSLVEATVTRLWSSTI